MLRVTGDAGERAPSGGIGLVLAAVGSLQFGAALAGTLFDEVGPLGAVLLRLGFGALILGALARPRVRGLSPPQRRLAVVFGLTLAGMNASIYAAFDRIGLGVAVTLEFVGPLAVAVAGSRRVLDVVWVLLAAAGIVLLSRGGTGGLDPVGVALALAAGGCWAAYIVLSARVGAAFAGADGLAVALAVGGLAVLPLGLADGGSGLLDPELLAVGAAVALLSSVIPYSFELEALRRIPTRLFGVLMSTEPAVAALAGFAILGEALAGRQVAGIGLVVLACAGATLRSGGAAPRLPDRSPPSDPPGGRPPPGG